MPRAYRLGERQASVEETRARIIAGARDLLMSADGFRHFTMDAIARTSNVSRMTVYYQFQSKTGIYEALADDLAARGRIEENAGAAFRCEDARTGLKKLIEAFVRFWLSDAEVMLKLMALSSLDPESRAYERDAWRVKAFDTMMRRVAQQCRLNEAKHQERVDALVLLTTFQSCYSLARSGRTDRQIATRIVGVAEAAIGLELA